MTRKSRRLNWKRPAPMYVLAAVSSVALSAFLALVVTRTVFADTPLSELIPTLASSPAASVAKAAASPAPRTLAIPAEPPAARSGPEAQSGQETQNGLENGPAAQRIEKHHRLHGLASWYGGIFNGRTTASGERFDMYAMTACHPTLPFGSLVRVINRRNHRSVVVRINDRGDLVDDARVIDLSYGAAEKLAMVQSGLAPVDLQVLSLGNGGSGK